MSQGHEPGVAPATSRSRSNGKPPRKKLNGSAAECLHYASIIIGTLAQRPADAYEAVCDALGFTPMVVMQRKADGKDFWSNGSLGDIQAWATRYYLSDEAKKHMAMELVVELREQALNRTTIHDVAPVRGGVQRILDSDQLTPGQRAAVSEMSQTATTYLKTRDEDGEEVVTTIPGALKVKLYDRAASQRLFGQAVGALVERRELSGPGGGPIDVKNMSDEQIDALIGKLLAAGGRDPPPDGGEVPEG